MRETIKDEQGVIRFKSNPIISELLDNYPGGLNKLLLKEWQTEDLEELYQAIGYSICGYCDISFVSEKSKDEAWEKLPEDTEEQTRLVEGMKLMKTYDVILKFRRFEDEKPPVGDSIYYIQQEAFSTYIERQIYRPEVFKNSMLIWAPDPYEQLCDVVTAAKRDSKPQELLCPECGEKLVVVKIADNTNNWWEIACPHLDWKSMMRFDKEELLAWFHEKYSKD